MRRQAGPLTRERPPPRSEPHQPGSATSPATRGFPEDGSGLSPGTDPETHSFEASHLSCSEEMTASASWPDQRLARRDHSGSRGPSKGREGSPSAGGGPATTECHRDSAHPAESSLLTPGWTRWCWGTQPWTRQATKTWILRQERETWRAPGAPDGDPNSGKEPRRCPQRSRW